MNEPKPLRFYWRGRLMEIDGLPPTLTLLDLLRERLGCTSAKEGCNEGDCGACAVVIARPRTRGGDAGAREGEVQGPLRYEAINACIRLASSIDGCALWSAQDIAQQGQLHAVQSALVDAHASQCGFCTPGFAMSLCALYENYAPQDEGEGAAAAAHALQAQRARVIEGLSGNLCRCTGYRPIVQAGQKALAQKTCDRPALSQGALGAQQLADALSAIAVQESLEHFLQRYAHACADSGHGGARVQLVAGCTDVGLWVNKAHQSYSGVFDLTQVEALRTTEQEGAHWRFGATVCVQEFFATLCRFYPSVRGFAERFAGRLVRNSATIGGNIGNGSPIGDSMPLLLALGAQLQLCRFDTEGGQLVRRRMPLAQFYRGYRQNALLPAEIIECVLVPLPQSGGECRQVVQAYKVSKRFEDDISAVCLCLDVLLRPQGQAQRIESIRIGVGGVAATPMRATQAEQAVQGALWGADTQERLAQALRQEFSPIDDLRASAAYRTVVLGNLVERLGAAIAGEAVEDLAHVSDHSAGALQVQ